jgi:hypothetical protein
MPFDTQLKSAAIILLVLLVLSGCGKSAPEANTTSTTASPAPAQATPRSSPRTEFEEALQHVKNGRFTYIWVFTRKDGKPFTPEDSPILRSNAPQVVDWVKADGNKKFLAGTNFDLEQNNLTQLRKRYVVELYTEP